MTQTIELIYDGTVLRPVGPVNLEKGKHYRAQINADEELEPNDPWDTIAMLAGSVEGPEDLAREHDHYLYGIPKRGSDNQ
ncbi:antitoxin family protein [Spirochaeta lutea]|uniref:DUF104 domain-containing protein n=1 Tax=Spirochaeta lutea TaxID=1480694 RepID=A0A098R0Y1_9SPIO|nr:antitoxin family protein [Spirochaeta lutea]KGE73308.1 hypothetical protein DC28_04710 [Spirochaeta lutea]